MAPRVLRGRAGRLNKGRKSVDCPRAKEATAAIDPPPASIWVDVRLTHRSVHRRRSVTMGGALRSSTSPIPNEIVRIRSGGITCTRRVDRPCSGGAVTGRIEPHSAASGGPRIGYRKSGRTRPRSRPGALFAVRCARWRPVARWLALGSLWMADGRRQVRAREPSLALNAQVNG